MTCNPISVSSFVVEVLPFPKTVGIYREDSKFGLKLNIKLTKISLLENEKRKTKRIPHTVAIHSHLIVSLPYCKIKRKEISKKVSTYHLH